LVTILTLTDGEELYYEVHGQGPPLVLISGLNGVGAFWKPHLEVLSRNFTVILHDHRGTGRSSPSRIDYSIEQMAGDLVELLDHLEIGQADMVGHSTGGAICQVLGIDQPERVASLVLSATWTAADGYFRRLFELRADVLRAMGPEGYLRASLMFMRPPAWIRDHDATQDEEIAAMAANFPLPEVMLNRIAWQLQQTMEQKKLTISEMARRMHTSRPTIDRLLDPENSSVTLTTLQKAASVLGRRLRLELV
jgi:aminoacrylate hydrolase